MPSLAPGHLKLHLRGAFTGTWTSQTPPPWCLHWHLDISNSTSVMPSLAPGHLKLHLRDAFTGTWTSQTPRLQGSRLVLQ
ncbi:hypothetical protein EYF80_049734 [Liparis tanakae]|uniref:Uncharacterized protein n=1 Tax=Liparis tanakae TaxID=230148 RepID=A0A4Z2FG19_9TELE|nr:hypothetical protein EYF80_049734 [Liparis tanakae]